MIRPKRGQNVMRILSIESSCDETAAAVVEDGRRICSSVVATQIAEHRKYGGVVPEIASRRHTEAVTAVTAQALDEAGLQPHELDAVAVTYAPGLIGALLVGVNFAKGFAYANRLPLIPVHHLRAHIAANYLAHPELEPPFLCLVVSGGHSHIVEVRDYVTMRIIGRTRDDAAGEAFDKAARAMGMPYPGGVALDAAAQSGNPHAYNMPRPHVAGSPYDFSFSGLKTFVVNLIHHAEQTGAELPRADIAASFRHAVVETLTENFLRAAQDLGYRRLVIAGGVSANSELRARLQSECCKIGAKLAMPPLTLCGDNAAMVGAQAYYEYGAGNLAGLDLNAYATMSIDAPNPENRAK